MLPNTGVLLPRRNRQPRDPRKPQRRASMKRRKRASSGLLLASRAPSDLPEAWQELFSGRFAEDASGCWLWTATKVNGTHGYPTQRHRLYGYRGMTCGALSHRLALTDAEYVVIYGKAAEVARRRGLEQRYRHRRICRGPKTCIRPDHWTLSRLAPEKMRPFWLVPDSHNPPKLTRRELNAINRALTDVADIPTRSL